MTVTPGGRLALAGHSHSYERSYLIDGPDDVEPTQLEDVACVGLTAGASAPEHLVQAVVAYLAARGWEAREVVAMAEDVKFQLPRELTEDNKNQ
jgi:4-hydroxy-3-methylbut-2-enyl diphosphate reductase